MHTKYTHDDCGTLFFYGNRSMLFARIVDLAIVNGAQHPKSAIEAVAFLNEKCAPEGCKFTITENALELLPIDEDDDDDDDDDAMTAEDFESALKSILVDLDFDLGTLAADDDENAIANVTTFEEGGYLTRDRGLRVTMKNGEEFQLTIVRSK